MSTARAWLMTLPDARQIAIGERELVHVFPESPPSYVVMGAPARCREVFLWRGRPAPMMHLGGESGTRHVLAVVAFASCTESDKVEFGALWLSAPPRRLTVSDEDAASPDEVEPDLRQVAHSAFRLGTETVPILDFSKVFGPAHARDSAH